MIIAAAIAKIIMLLALGGKMTNTLIKDFNRPLEKAERMGSIIAFVLYYSIVITIYYFAGIFNI